jgi:hypothetical protein
MCVRVCVNLSKSMPVRLSQKRRMISVMQSSYEYFFKRTCVSLLRSEVQLSLIVVLRSCHLKSLDISAILISLHGKVLGDFAGLYLVFVSDVTTVIRPFRG